MIISWNESEVLRRCLDSFYKHFDFDRDEIVLADNGSTDETVQMLVSEFPAVRVLELGKNLGVGRARNRGIAYSRGDYIMTLDNDTIVDCGSALGPTIERIFRENKNIGVFGFTLLNTDGSFQQSCRRFPGWLQPIAARIPALQSIRLFQKVQTRHMMEDVNFSDVKYPFSVDYVLGANQIFRRKTFALLFGYDEKVFFGPEDFDFCFRAKKLGLENYLFNCLSITHDYQRRTRRFSLILLKHLWAYYYVMRKLRISHC
ncbi:MAG: hypothetical protein Aurels2KO_20860 [Aureliella sp.]